MKSAATSQRTEQQAPAEPFWHAVVSEREPVINKAIRSEEVADEYAAKCQEQGYRGAEVIPLYRHPPRVIDEAVTLDLKAIRNDILSYYKEHYAFPSQGEEHMRDVIDDVLESVAHLPRLAEGAAEELLTEIRTALNESGVWHLGMTTVDVIKSLIAYRAHPPAAETKALKEDAARYRWLRGGEVLDATVDAALAADQKGGQHAN